MIALRPVIAVTLLLAALIGLGWPTAAYAAGNWQLQSSRGTVLRYADDRWVEMSSSEIVTIGTSIRTLSGAAAVIVSDGARVHLGGTTSVRISERRRTVLVEQFIGTIEVVVEQGQAANFAIRTPSMEISALAGTLVVEVNKTGTTFDVTNGMVRVLDIATGAVSVVATSQQEAAEEPITGPVGSAATGSAATTTANTTPDTPSSPPAGASAPASTTEPEVPTPTGQQNGNNGQPTDEGSNANGSGNGNGNGNGAGNGNGTGNGNGNGNGNGAGNGNGNGAGNGNGNGKGNGKN